MEWNGMEWNSTFADREAQLAIQFGHAPTCRDRERHFLPPHGGSGGVTSATARKTPHLSSAAASRLPGAESKPLPWRDGANDLVGMMAEAAGLSVAFHAGAFGARAVPGGHHTRGAADRLPRSPSSALLHAHRPALAGQHLRSWRARINQPLMLLGVCLQALHWWQTRNPLWPRCPRCH